MNDTKTTTRWNSVVPQDLPQTDTAESPDPGVNWLSLFLKRIGRAASLGRPVYSEVASDNKATLQAVLVVIIVAAITGISASIGTGLKGLQAVPAFIFLAFVGWVLWTTITYVIGGKILRTENSQTDWKSLARALGFAQSPGLLRLLGLVPGLAIPVSLVTMVWILVAMVIAIREAMGHQSYWKSTAVLAVGLIPYLSVMVFLSLLVSRP